VYSLKWEEDIDNNFLRWVDPDFLGNWKINGSTSFVPSQYVLQDEIRGVIFVDKDHNDYFIIDNKNLEDFEFQNDDINLTVKKVKTLLNKDLVVTIIVFTNDFLKTIEGKNLSVLNLYNF